MRACSSSCGTGRSDSEQEWIESFVHELDVIDAGIAGACEDVQAVQMDDPVVVDLVGHDVTPVRVVHQRCWVAVTWYEART